MKPLGAYPTEGDLQMVVEEIESDRTEIGSGVHQRH